MQRTSVGSSIPLAWALMIASLFLPASTFGDSSFSGATALAFALTEGGVFGAISAFTNLAFLASILVFFRRNRKLITVLAIAVTLSFVFNVWWLIDSKGEDLLIGYYTWLAAFAVLAAGLFVLRRSTPPVEVPSA